MSAQREVAVSRTLDGVVGPLQTPFRHTQKGAIPQGDPSNLVFLRPEAPVDMRQRLEAALGEHSIYTAVS